MKLFKLSSIFWFCFIYLKDSEAVGEVCTIEGKAGTCEPIRAVKCEKILKVYQRHHTSLQLCDRATRTVCCPDKIIPAPEPTGISGKKCQEYSDQIYKNGTSCSRAAVALIVGGENTTVGEFPHSALIGYESSTSDYEYVCQGSLISERWVLSAAHCSAAHGYGIAKYVKFGNVVRGQDNNETFKYEIVERVKHPNYTMRLIDNDIMLFKLDRDVEFSSSVAPICLPHFNIEPKKAIATGWGHVGYYKELSGGLLKVKLNIFNQTNCQDKFSKEDKAINGIDYETKICAGSQTEDRDTCSGDSGGPLQVYNVNKVSCMYHIVGITSFGHADCGKPGVPGVYTRVFPYLKWIENIVWPEL